MRVSEAKPLKALEEENVKLKKLLAEQMLEAAALREFLSKNGRVRPGQPHEPEVWRGRIQLEGPRTFGLRNRQTGPHA